jgi:hypothetical protein
MHLLRGEKSSIARRACGHSMSQHCSGSAHPSAIKLTLTLVYSANNIP